MRQEIKIQLQNIYILIFFSLFFLVPLVFKKEAYNFIFIKDVIFINLVGILFLLFFFQKKINIKNKSLYPLSIIFWFLILFVFTKYKYAGVLTFYRILFLYLLFFITANIKINILHIRNILIITSYPVVFIGLIQITFPDIMKGFLVFGNRIPSTLGNPNFYAAYLVSILPIILWRIFYSLSYRKFLYSGYFLILIFSLLKTGSKAGIITFLFEITLFFFFILKEKYLKLQKRIIWTTLFIVIIFMIFLNFFHINKKNILKRDEWLKNDSVFFRIYTWKGTLNLIKNNILTGTGLNTFSIVFPEYRPKEIMRWTYRHSYEITYPENIFLQIAAETGIIGLILFLFILLIILKEFKKEGREIIDFKIGFLGILFINLFGVDINYITSSMFFSFYSGIIVNGGKTNEIQIALDKKNKNFFIFIFSVFFLYVNIYFFKNLISDIYLQKAVYFSKDKKFNLAIRNYEQSLKYNSNNLDALYFLANAYMDLNELQKSLNIYEKLEKLAPNYILLHYKKAHIYKLMKRYDLAKEEYKKMLRFDPYLKEALVELAYIYFKEYKFNLAEKYILQAIERYKNDASLYNNLGNIYFSSKRVKEAIRAYKNAIKLKEDKDYYYNLGCVYFTLNDIKNAKKCILKAKRLDKENSKKIKKMLYLIDRYEKITGNKRRK